MQTHQGGCLCGHLRYETHAGPARIVYCHCRFCQRATGSAYLVELIFPRTAFRLVQGTPTAYTLTSAGSGKQVKVNFCATCGTKIFLELERVPADIGLYAGTYDDPNWWDRNPVHSKHIFFGVAQRGAVISPGIPVFHEHVTDRDGTAQMPMIFEVPHIVP